MNEKMVAPPVTLPGQSDDVLKYCDWIDPGKLMAGNYPVQQIPSSPNGDVASAWDVSRLRALLGEGMRCFIDLTHRQDPIEGYGDILQRTARPLRIRAVYHRCQIFDCSGGKGRTGTVVGYWLARHGIAQGEEVLTKIRQLRRKKNRLDLPSPPHPDQNEFVKKWRVGK